MTAPFAPRIRAGRWIAALAATTVCALAAAAGPAIAEGTAKPAQAAAGKTVTLRYYVETAAFVYRRADGTVAAQPPATPAAGDQLEITELGYKGTHKSHAKKLSVSAYTVCHFKTAKPAPTCEGAVALGSELMIFRTAGGDPVLIGGTGRFAGVTGGLKSTEIPNSDNTDVVITAHLKK